MKNSGARTTPHCQTIIVCLLPPYMGLRPTKLDCEGSVRIIKSKRDTLPTTAIRIAQLWMCGYNEIFNKFISRGIIAALSLSYYTHRDSCRPIQCRVGWLRWYN